MWRPGKAQNRDSKPSRALRSPTHRNERSARTFQYGDAHEQERRPRMTNRVTLITGASAGIGIELARVFASKGHRLALVDRRGDGLTTLASEIVAAGNPAPILIAC